MNLIITCTRNSHNTTMMDDLAIYCPAVPIEGTLGLVTVICVMCPFVVVCAGKGRAVDLES